MASDLEKVNDILNVYLSMNIHGGEKKTCLKDIESITIKKWNKLTNDMFPKYSEECPMDKCYNEEFDSFYSLNNSKEIDGVVKQYNETSIKGEVETLDIDVPQKRL